MSFEPTTLALAETLVALCRSRGITLATAESCTGGMVSAAVTAVAGASAVYLGGIVAYAEALKQKLLGVSEKTLAEESAVSAKTAEEMAKGALLATGADLAVSVTGYAGPGDGAGLVYIAVADRDSLRVRENRFEGDRHTVRLAAAAQALSLCIEAVNIQK